MARVGGVDIRSDPRESEEILPPITANCGAEEWYIYTTGCFPEYITDGSGDRGKELWGESVDEPNKFLT